MSFDKIGEYFKHFDKIMSFYITGYFALFVVYGNLFLMYDVLTRSVLSISASILLLLPSSKLLYPFVSKVRLPVFQIFHGISSIVVFTLIKFLNYEIALKQMPILYIFPLVIINLIIVLQIKLDKFLKTIVLTTKSL